jgi:hypothetical protein
MSDHKSNVADYDLLYITQTEKGLCVRRSEDDQLFWLPKSQVEFDDKEYRRHAVVSVTIPDWLAEKHDLA